MTHAAHLLRTDLRRFGLAIALWVLVLIADTVLQGVRPALNTDLRLSTVFDLLATLLFASRWLGMIVIVALVVQSHALVGSEAFWMTRPIRWRDLLASKIALLVTAFVVAPALCDVGLMLASRVPSAEIPRVALQTALFQCLWLLLFMALSSWTRNLARLAVLAGCVLIGLMLLLNVTIAVMVRNFPEGPQLTRVIVRTMTSPAGAIVMLLVAIVLAGAIVAVQYRTRLIRASVATAAAGIAVLYLIANFWPSQERPRPVPGWTNGADAVRLVSESPEAEFSPFDAGSPWSPGGGWRIGSLPLRITGIEDGWVATPRLENGTITFGDGATLATAGNGYSGPARASADDTLSEVAVRHALSVTRLLEPVPEGMGPGLAPAIVVAQADFEKYQGATGTYRGQFVVDLDRVVAAATLPLQVGATFQDDRHRIRIDQVIPQSRALSVRLRQFTSSSIFDSTHPPQVTLYLRNRSSSEAVSGSPRGQIGFSGGAMHMSLAVGFSVEPAASGTGFSITGSFTRFPAGYGERIVELSREWLSQAELVILHTITEGSVTRSVEVPGFRMVEAPARSAR